MKTTRWMMVLGLGLLIGCKAKSQPLAAEPATAHQDVPCAVTPPPSPTSSLAAAPASPIPTEVKKASDTMANDAKTSDAKAAVEAKILVKRLVLAQGVEDREPVDAKTSFAKDGGKIYAFVEVENADRVASEIEVEFVPPQGAPRGNVLLKVGEAPRWRTWAYTRTARDVGEWTAVVKNRRGEVLARAPFEVTG